MLVLIEYLANVGPLVNPMATLATGSENFLLPTHPEAILCLSPPLASKYFDYSSLALNFLSSRPLDEVYVYPV